MKYFFLLLAVFVLSSCDSSVESTQGVLIPLSEGNSWVYEQSIYDSLHILIGRTYDTVNLGAAITIDGERWYPVYHRPQLISYDDSLYMTNRSDGVWARSVSLGRTYIRMLDKYPTSANDTFNLKISAAFPAEATLEKTFKMTIGTDEQVTIPPGTFSSIHYRTYIQQIDSLTGNIKSSTVLADQYVSPGIGEVRSAFQIGRVVGPIDSLRIETSDYENILISYTIK